MEHYGARDAFTNAKLHPRYLQIDHRIPYEVVGDVDHKEDVADFLLIDASSQRAKSWSCENCNNLRKLADPENCKTCFWAYPENYAHIAMEPMRRVDILWKGDEVLDFERLKATASAQKMTLSEFIKLKLKAKRS